MAKNKVFDIKVIGRILSLAKPYRKAFITSAILACCLSFLGPLRPMLIQKAVDVHIMSMDLEGLEWISLILLIVLMGESLSRYFFMLVSNWLGQSIIRDLRVKVFNHLTALKLSFYDITPIGNLNTRTINDIESINSIFTQGIVTILSDVLTIGLVLYFMFSEDAMLSLLTLSSLPLMFLSTYIFQKNIRSATKKVRDNIAKINAFLQEYITGIHIVQVFVKDQRIINDFDKINKKHRDAHIETIWYYSIFFPVVEMLTAISVGVILWYGGREIVEQDNVSLGHIISFILYIHLLFRPIRQLADKFGTLQTGIIASERVFEVLDSEEVIKDEGRYVTQEIKGKIEFDQVNFSYDGKKQVLNNISFDVNSGETIAFVGATGAGKSSIINILSRFYEISSGTIKIDDKDIHEYELDGLRKHIGIVLQDVFLFSGTIYENICLKDERISLETVIEAAKLVGVHEMITQLPDGYNFEVGERGVTLSMGQRQLIAFVRALVYNPKVLILDEATSSIDTESELLIQKATETLVKGRTSIIIAHRLSTIQHADKIMVLDKGGVVEIGTPALLMKLEDGWYRKLYETQFKLQELG